MKVFLCAALAATLASRATASAVTPVQKVLELLGDMIVKAEAEKHEEMKKMASFMQFCESTKAHKEKSISDAAAAIEQLNADIEKALSDAETLGSEIKELDAKLDGMAADMASATSVRNEENAAYKATHLDYEETLTACAKAIAVLSSKSANVPQALLQFRAVAEQRRVPAAARDALQSLLQVDTEVSAPEANAYEFQSSSVITMLEKLEKKFKKEQLALEKEEMNKRTAYDLLMQRLTDETEHDTAVRKEKAAAKAAALEDAADKKLELADTEKGKKEDEAYLTDLITGCGSKKKDFDSRQELRAQEIEAIKKAVEIISSPDVAGAAEKHLPSALQVATAPALAQLRSAMPQEMQNRAATLLAQRAQSSGSRLLAMVAEHASDDPFAKVKKMIKDLIAKLIEEANAEADHKSWCDEELADNKKTRDEYTAEVEKLTAKVDELTARIAQLATDIEELEAGIIEVTAAMKKATEERLAEKATNTKTIEEAKTAQHAISSALTVLKDFYDKAATATALAQRGFNEDAPETFDKPYQGLQGMKHGPIGLLETIQSDFARLEADTTAEESEAAREFVTFMRDSKVDKATKETSLKHSISRKMELTHDLADTKKDLRGAHDGLQAANEYFEKLKPSCLDLGLSYEERVRKRKEEIVALQEALMILSGEEIA